MDPVGGDLQDDPLALDLVGVGTAGVALRQGVDVGPGLVAPDLLDDPAPDPDVGVRRRRPSTP